MLFALYQLQLTEVVTRPAPTLVLLPPYIQPQLVIFLPLNNDLFLASALAFAGGIMSYVSFIDIYSNKAVGSFAAAGFSPALSYLLASVW